MRYQYTYDMKIGKLTIREDENYITHILHTKESNETMESFDGYEIKETQYILETKNQLEEYFLGIRNEFQLPILPKGTEFQKKVWEELRRIPYGTTASYKEIAIRIGNPNAQRAVGMANNKNPILIVTPCHRVIGKNGALVGFGAGLEVKEILLGIETRTE